MPKIGKHVYAVSTQEMRFMLDSLPSKYREGIIKAAIKHGIIVKNDSYAGWKWTREIDNQEHNLTKRPIK